METHSVAIPHTEFEHVNRTGFAIGINLAGVEFQRTDEPEEAVVPQIVVMMAIDKTCEKWQLFNPCSPYWPIAIALTKSLK
ncbi:Phosphoenolpyruvate-dependent sugar phosphotransferase system, EIIA 2 [Raoultella terrigena]|uniref:Phosphoenolpyruvate-dependent sugar phosphotransferase system, EIIA 2 n=1 Tax=Raoultella terrigena TaxID=577 RepID=A0A3P8KTX4_RAOTE|nr:Phosphoenolpyruvate-dependent sugar phosphotransferase system, EIIA 2 [Raoultella terrigena]